MALAESPVDGNLVAAREIALTPCWASDAQWLQRSLEPPLLVVPAAQPFGIVGPVALWERAQPIRTVPCEHVFEYNREAGQVAACSKVEDRRAGLGRLPGSQRPGDPPALGVGLLRVRSAGGPSLAEHPAQPAPPTPRPPPDGRAGGISDQTSGRNRLSGSTWPVAVRAVRAWLTPMERAATLLAVVVASPAAPAAARAA
jgi:hypothetical protein